MKIMKNNNRILLLPFSAPRNGLWLCEAIPWWWEQVLSRLELIVQRLILINTPEEGGLIVLENILSPNKVDEMLGEAADFTDIVLWGESNIDDKGEIYNLTIKAKRPNEEKVFTSNALEIKADEFFDGLNGLLKELANFYEWKLEEIYQPTNVLSALQYFADASLAGLEGRYEEAKTYYNKALKEDNHFAYAHIKLGAMCELENKYEEAINHYENALDINDKLAIAYFGLGCCYQRKAEIRKTQEDYQEALKKAEKYYYKALELESNKAITHYNLALLLDHQQRDKEAIEHYNNALRLQPNYTIVYNALGLLYYHQNKLDLAETHLEKAIEYEPNNAMYLTNLAGILLAQKNLDEALEKINKALELQPKLLLAKLYKAMVYAEKNESEEALKIYKELEEKSPSAAIYNNIGLEYHKLEDYKKAREYFEKAIEIGSSSPLVLVEAYLNLAVICNKLKDRDACENAWKEAKKISPKHPGVKRLKKELDIGFSIPDLGFLKWD